MSPSAPNGPVPRSRQDHPVTWPDHFAGAAPSATVLVWLWPVTVSHSSLTLVPGRRPDTLWVSPVGEVTGWPLTEVSTSPLTRPAAPAAVPHSTPSTSAPRLTGAIEAGTEVSELSRTQPLARWPDPDGPVPPDPVPPPEPEPCWDCCRSCCRCWAACCCGLLLLLCGTRTPRNPGSPIATVPLRWPAAIWWATSSAVLIGMA